MTVMNITLTLSVLHYFDQINSAFMSMKGIFQKLEKFL